MKRSKKKYRFRNPDRPRRIAFGDGFRDCWVSDDGEEICFHPNDEDNAELDEIFGTMAAARRGTLVGMSSNLVFPD